MKNRTAPRLLALASAATLTVAVAGPVQAAVILDPGAFEYRYDSQNATGTGAADPNADLNNMVFSGDGGSPNNDPNYVNFYALETLGNLPDDQSLGSLSYTFDASANHTFSGNVSVTDRINVFNFQGNIRGEFSTDGGATFTDFTQRGTGDAEYETNLIDADGATSITIRYNVFSLAPVGQEDQVQLFRQANVNLQNLENTPFVVSGETVIPEPASLALMGLGGLMVLRRRTRTRIL